MTHLILHYFGFSFFLLVVAFAAAGITDLYAFSIGDPNRHDQPRGGRIASSLGMWLFVRYKQYDATTLQLREAKERAAKNRHQLQEARMFTRANPFKMAGVCPRCCNVWVTLLVAVPVAFVLSYPWWSVIIIVGLSNLLFSLVAKWR